MKKEKIILLLTLLFGLYLRIYRLEALAGFDFDQEKAAFWLKNLLVDGKFSLIGQEISTGGVFIGPLYYYLLAPFYLFFKMDPIAANILASFLAVATMFTLYKVGQTLFSKKVGLLALFLYAVSFRLNFYDRTTAPSNLVMLLSLLIFQSLLKIKSGATNWVFVIAICLGLGFSIHPTMMALFIIVFGILLLSRAKVGSIRLLLFIAILFLFLSPLLIFDIRHNFLNLHGILKVLQSSSFSLSVLVSRIGANWQSLVISLESLLLPIHTGGLFITVIFLLNLKKDNTPNHRLSWLTIWLFVPFILLSFYPLNVPEYYFLLTFPVFIIFLAYWLEKLFFRRTIILYVLILLLSLVNLSTLASYNYLVSMKNKKDAVKLILEESKQEKFRVDYWTSPGQKNGFDYLFWHFGAVPDQTIKQGKRFVIAIPPKKEIEKQNDIFGGIQIIKDTIKP